jgi:hypothetical protein
VEASILDAGGGTAESRAEQEQMMGKSKTPTRRPIRTLTQDCRQKMSKKRQEGKDSS